MAYHHRRSITIDHDKVPNTDQTNFPMLFSGTYSYLADGANGGEVKTANGYDIVFTSDAAGSDILDFQRSAWINTTGRVVFWVSVPSLSHTVDTVIYLHYGKSGDSDHSSAASVWTSANYVAVHHLDDASEANMVDSTGNDVISPAAHHPHSGTGKIYKCMDFVSSDTQYAAGSDNDCPTGSAARTMSGWWKSNPYVQDKEIFGYGTIGTAARGWYFRHGASPKLTMETGAGTGQDFTWVTDDANWHLAHWSAPAGGKINDIKFYMDGELKAFSATRSGTTTLNTLGDAKCLGHRNVATGAYFLDGSIEEFRISSDEKSADWAATEYNNQSDPATFYSVSDPDIAGGNFWPTFARILTMQQ